MKRKILSLLFVLLILFAGLFLLYFNNTNLVDSKTRVFYSRLKERLQEKGYSPSLLVISTKRVKWHNDFQVLFSGAAKNSRHLVGDALDFLVFDVNRDGNSDGKDVDIVVSILDKQIIKNRGGIGTYKTESLFINRQMVHIDCRGYRARWAR